MRLTRACVVALLLVACSAPTSGTPTAPPSHQAADLRVRLSLLFGENAMIIAKESEAAALHSDEYAGYLSLLATNAEDLRSVIGLAFGNTAADGFFEMWTGHNASAVDYAIGVVTHNADMANQALTNLGSSAAAIGDFFTSRLHLARGALTEHFNAQVTPFKEFVDDAFAQNYGLMYSEIDIAYVVASGLGDQLAPLIAAQFPDKFPGELASQAVTSRVITNDRLQERAYLLTMATDALIGGRDAERQQAVAELGVNAGAIDRFKDVWARQVAAVVGYAGDASMRRALTQDFVTQMSSTAGVPPTLVGQQAAAMAAVIDDQRAKSWKTLAGDDRASATAMQPVADAIAASAQG